jgi:hypothetical protein
MKITPTALSVKHTTPTTLNILEEMDIKPTSMPPSITMKSKDYVTAIRDSGTVRTIRPMKSSMKCLCSDNSLTKIAKTGLTPMTSAKATKTYRRRMMQTPNNPKIWIKATKWSNNP